MQPAGRGIADVHAGPLADVGGIVEDLDVFRVDILAVGDGDPRHSSFSFGFENNAGLIGHAEAYPFDASGKRR